MRIENLLAVPELTRYNSAPARTLLPASIRKKVPSLSAVEDESDPMLYVRLFAPIGPTAYWYIAAADHIPASSTSPEDERLLVFAGHDVFCPAGEWGLASLLWLRQLHLGFYLGVERDLAFKPCRFSKLRAG